MTLGSQSGTITGGVGGTATFAVTTTNVTVGTEGSFTWYSDAAGTTNTSVPAGITPAVTAVASNAATVTLTATNSAVAGSYYFKLTEGSAVSAVATLTVSSGDLTSANIGTLKLIPGGTFYNRTAPLTVSSFHLGATDITQAQYLTVTGNNPSYFTGDTSRPVEKVTWYDAVEFCNKLSTLEGKTLVYTITSRTPETGYPITSATVEADFTKTGYRLPTEAQWMWAAMGGNSDSKSGDIVGGVNTGGYNKAFAGSNGSNVIDNYAWYSANSDSTTHAVGGKTANELGLHDMSGNVFQWCWDWYGSYPSDAQTDYTGASSGTSRVLRGGGWFCDASICTVSYRGGSYPSNRNFLIGFRVAAP